MLADSTRSRRVGGAPASSMVPPGSPDCCSVTGGVSMRAVRRRSARAGALLRDQPLGGGQHLLEAALVDRNGVLAGHHQRRGALDLGAGGELAGAVDLGVDAEAAEGVGEALGVHAVLGI